MHAMANLTVTVGCNTIITGYSISIYYIVRLSRLIIQHRTIFIVSPVSRKEFSSCAAAFIWSQQCTTDFYRLLVIDVRGFVAPLYINRLIRPIASRTRKQTDLVLGRNLMS